MSTAGEASLHVSAAGHSTAQHSTAQHSTAQHSTAGRSTAQQGAAQHSRAQHSTAGRSRAQQGRAQQGTAGHSRAGHSRAQQGTAGHSTAQHSTAQHSTAQQFGRPQHGTVLQPVCCDLTRPCHHIATQPQFRSRILSLAAQQIVHAQAHWRRTAVVGMAEGTPWPACACHQCTTLPCELFDKVHTAGMQNKSHYNDILTTENPAVNCRCAGK